LTRCIYQPDRFDRLTQFLPEPAMQPRKSFALILLMTLLCGTVQLAVADDAAAPAPQLNIEDLRARLNLSAEQQAQIQPLVEQRKAKMEEIRTRLSAATSRRDKRAVLQDAKGVQDDFNNTVTPLLTKEQQAEWTKIRAEVRDHMKERLRERKS
jgi:hypothetical protein